MNSTDQHVNRISIQVPVGPILKAAATKAAHADGEQWVSTWVRSLIAARASELLGVPVEHLLSDSKIRPWPTPRGPDNKFVSLDNLHVP